MSFRKDIENSWGEALPLVQKHLNVQHVDSIGTSPARIIFDNLVVLNGGML